VLVIASAMSCPADPQPSSGRVIIGPTSVGEPVPAGDTVRFSAAYFGTSSDTVASATSQSNSGEFQWSVDDSTLASVDASGTVLTRKAGEVEISVVGPKNVAASRTLVIGPRIAALRLDPATATIHVADSVTLHVAALDSAGAAVSYYVGLLQLQRTAKIAAVEVHPAYVIKGIAVGTDTVQVRAGSHVATSVITVTP
jgi:hypothetical protein